MCWWVWLPRQAASAVLRNEDVDDERTAQSSASKLALRCATGAVELHAAMREAGADSADGSQLLLSGAHEMRSLADAQLMHGDPQMQVRACLGPFPPAN